MNVPEGGRGFRNFGQQNPEKAGNFSEPNFTLINKPQRERRSRFSEPENNVLSNVAPGTEENPEASEPLTKISPSLEQRLNTVFSNINANKIKENVISEGQLFSANVNLPSIAKSNSNFENKSKFFFQK